MQIEIFTFFYTLFYKKIYNIIGDNMNRQTVMEIDKDAFFKNIENIKKLSGNKELMYIMKANSYGTYLNKHIDIIKDFKIIGVAIVKEAIELRQIGFKNEIFVLNQP